MKLTTSTIIDQTGKEYENTPIELDIQMTAPIEKGKLDQATIISAKRIIMIKRASNNLLHLSMHV
ncbi:hypothetical protein ACTQ5J_09540 [Fundicoccus sp. Sow4_F4]|uniref:hypothetical protein n=1 Tax=Fundicoccus sp. Sow4_F4 TaxID=3438783 RepID=UPI003F92758F